jgi:hypothetical protein
MPVPALVRRKELWVPTLWGWLALAVAGMLLAAAVVRGLYPLLAMTEPVGGPVLIVEGWMAPKELEEAAIAYSTGRYTLVITTGGPVHHGWLGTYKETYADQAAEFLRYRGLPPRAIVAVPSAITQEDRTFHSALRVREWAKRANVRIDGADVVSAGPHTRRSRLLYQLALGEDVRVGAIATRPYDYDPARWWRSSVGAKDVWEQAVGLLWVKWFFQPPRAASF